MNQKNPASFTYIFFNVEKNRKVAKFLQKLLTQMQLRTPNKYYIHTHISHSFWEALFFFPRLYFLKMFCMKEEFSPGLISRKRLVARLPSVPEYSPLNLPYISRHVSLILQMN